jgi:hypothetical protein
MNPVSLSIFHLAPRITALVALVVLAWCAAVLLGSVMSDLAVASQVPTDGPLLAPFRWAPLADTYA